MNPAEPPHSEFPEIDEKSQKALEFFIQGDVVPIEALSIVSCNGEVGRRHVCVEGLSVVISQTCDLRQRGRHTAQVAPLVRLSGAAAREAASGRRPQYAPLPAFGEDAFVDFSIICTIDKVDLASLERKPGVSEPNDKLALARAIGRKFARFPFPDDLHLPLSALQDLARQSHGRDGSDIGKVFRRVTDLRLEEESIWEKPPYRLTLHVVVESKELPFSADDLPAEPPDVRDWLVDPSGQLTKSPKQIATKLESAANVVQRTWLWIRFGQSLEVAITKADSKKAIADIGSSVVPVDEFSLFLYRRSVEVDLDYLSPPIAQ